MACDLRNKARLVAGAVLVGATTSLSVQSLAVSVYLPASHTMIENCRKAAQTLHPGEIEYVGERVRDGKYYYIVELRAANTGEWLMACDGEGGKIIKAVHLDRALDAAAAK
jgi:hypothetical protein